MNSPPFSAATFDWHRWVGLPFAPRGRGPSYDCWGLIWAVLREVGHDLPSLLDDGVATGEQKARLDQWKPVPPGDPQLFDIAAFCYTKDTLHLGLVCGPGVFLHTAGGEGSSMDNFLQWPWRSCLKGFYRFQAARVGL
jgi:cell wall-associated NlpC family hydrolase